MGKCQSGALGGNTNCAVIDAGTKKRKSETSPALLGTAKGSIRAGVDQAITSRLAHARNGDDLYYTAEWIRRNYDGETLVRALESFTFEISKPKHPVFGDKYSILVPPSLFPVTSHLVFGISQTETVRAVADLLDAVDETVQAIVKASKAFVKGLFRGLKGTLTDQDYALLADQLGYTAVANVVVWPVVASLFGAGAAVGILQDAWGTLKGIYELITDWEKIKDAVLKLIREIFRDPEIAGQLGEQVGKDLAKKIQKLARHSLPRFIFELGRFIGPTIVYTVLALMGVTAWAVVARGFKALITVLKKSKNIAKLLETLEGLFKTAKLLLPEPKIPHFKSFSEALNDARQILGGMLVGGKPKFKNVKEIDTFMKANGLKLAKVEKFGPKSGNEFVTDAAQLIYETADKRIVVKIKTRGYQNGMRPGGTMSVEIMDGKGPGWENTLCKLDNNGNVIAKNLIGNDDVVSFKVNVNGQELLEAYTLTMAGRKKLQAGQKIATHRPTPENPNPDLRVVTKFEVIEGGKAKPRNKDQFANLGHLDFDAFDSKGTWDYFKLPQRFSILKKRIADALKSGNPSLKLEAEVATRYQNGVRRFNEKVFWKDPTTGKKGYDVVDPKSGKNVITDVDVELHGSIIEVKGGTASTTQLLENLKHLMANPSNKPVILFAPGISSKKGLNTIEKKIKSEAVFKQKKIYIARDWDQLDKLVKQFGDHVETPGTK